MLLVEVNGSRGLHDKRAVVGEMGSDALEAAHLALLGQQVEQHVERHEDQPVDVALRDVGPR